MKIVIMAAGKGTRMLPLTKNIPKVLVEVNGKPFLYYLMKHFQNAGFNDFALIVGYKKEQFPAFLEKYNFKATLIEQDKQLGTGHAAKLAKDFVGNDNFILCGGDTLFSADDLKLISYEDNLNYIAGLRSKTPEKYGVLFAENGKLIKIVEKPKEFVGDLINLGFYKFTPEIFTALDQIELSPRGEYELTDAITILAKQGKVNVHTIKDYWLDLGCIDDIPRISEFLKEKK